MSARARARDKARAGARAGTGAGARVTSSRQEDDGWRRRRLCELHPDEVKAVLEMTQMGAEVQAVSAALDAARETAGAEQEEGKSPEQGEADLLLECLADHLAKAARRITALTLENGELKSDSATYQRLRTKLRERALQVKALGDRVSAAEDAAAAAQEEAKAAKAELAAAKAHYRDKDARVRMEAQARVKRARSALKVDKRVTAMEDEVRRAREAVKEAQREAARATADARKAERRAGDAELRGDKHKTQLESAMAVSHAFEEQIRQLKAKLDAAAALYKKRQAQWEAQIEAANQRYAEMHDHWSSIHKATAERILAAQQGEAAQSEADLVALLRAMPEPAPPTHALSVSPDQSVRVAELESLVAQLESALDTSHQQYLEAASELGLTKADLRAAQRELNAVCAAPPPDVDSLPSSDVEAIALRARVRELEATAARVSALEGELEHAHSLLEARAEASGTDESEVYTASLSAELAMVRAKASRSAERVAELETELMRARTLQAASTPATSAPVAETPLTPSTSRTQAQLARLQGAADAPLTPVQAREVFSGAAVEPSPGASPDLTAKVIALQAINDEKDQLLDTMQATFELLASEVRAAREQANDSERENKMARIAYAALQGLVSTAEALQLRGINDLGLDASADEVEALSARVVQSAGDARRGAVAGRRQAKQAKMQGAAAKSNAEAALEAKANELRIAESQLSSLSYAMEKDAVAAKAFRKKANAALRAARDEAATLKRANTAIDAELMEAKRSLASVKAKFAAWRKEHSSCLLHKGGSRAGVRRVLAMLQTSLEGDQITEDAVAISGIVDSYVRCLAHYDHDSASPSAHGK